MNKPAKPRAPRKPKVIDAPKVAKKVKPPTPEQEARERQIQKDNAPLVKKVSALADVWKTISLIELQMAAFLQRPPPRYMTQEQSERKRELLEDKDTLLANIKDAEERLEKMMDPVRILKNEIGSYKSTLNYNGKELRTFFGMREPGEAATSNEEEQAGKEIASLFEEAPEEEDPVSKEEEGLFVAQP